MFKIFSKSGLGYWVWLAPLFPVNYRKAQGLKFCGEGEGCGLAITMF